MTAIPAKLALDSGFTINLRRQKTEFVTFSTTVGYNLNFKK